jgi:sugar transferase EpsL
MRGPHYRWLKRTLDVVGAGALLVLCLPLLLVVAALVRVTMGAPVLFRQRRPGLGGQPFVLLKFRTMTEGRIAQGRRLGDAERVTRVGRLLRRLSIDEVPQLLNVLKGEMSLVGPRPLLMEYLPCYRERERTRHLVRPGITGLAQINGRNRLGWDERLEFDARYAEGASLPLDLQIIFRTFSQALLGRDVVIDALPDLTDERLGRPSGQSAASGSGEPLPGPETGP